MSEDESRGPPAGPGRSGWRLPAASTDPHRLRFGVAVEGIFRLYRRRPGLLLAISAVVEVPIILVSVPLGQRLVGAMTALLGFSPLAPPAVMPEAFPPFAASVAADLAVSLAALVIVGMVVGALATAALALVLGESTADRSPTIAGTMRRLALRLPALLLAQAVYLAAVGVVFVGGLLLVSALIGLAPDPASGGALVFLGLVALVAVVALTIFLALRLGFWPQAVVLERVGALDALRRSWRLVSGSTWRVVGYAIALGMLDYLLTALLSRLGSAVLDLAVADPGAGATLLLGWRIVVTVVVAPVVPLGMTMLFLDLRRQRGDMPSPEAPPA